MTIIFSFYLKSSFIHFKWSWLQHTYTKFGVKTKKKWNVQVWRNERQPATLTASKYDENNFTAIANVLTYTICIIIFFVATAATCACTTQWNVPKYLSYESLVFGIHLFLMLWHCCFFSSSFFIPSFGCCFMLLLLLFSC